MPIKPLIGTLALVSESTVEPLTVADARTFLRITATDSTAEDALILDFIRAARLQAENKTKRALVRKTWRYDLRDFPSATAAIELPRAPLSTATTDVSITYVEDTTSGNTTTVGATAYTVDFRSTPGRVYPSYGNEWPNVVRDEHGAVRIQYISGYSSSTTPIPAPILHWIRARVMDLYEHRGAHSTEIVRSLPSDAIDGLLDEWVIP